ncbi:hypothetical protein [Formosa sp. L2A11]|uniref:hypothetical protein n=1 Tax=Formosa sp. L2A11 TaxID=2686363 RepID=UPI00131D7482|nr:hypothetical protein [Formosa sp. L2A11]
MNRFLLFILLSFSFGISSAQEWMTNLEVAERLALTQNKLLVVVWEDAYNKGIPIYVNDSVGQEVLVDNMFEEPVIDSLLWDRFVPVILSEDNYSKLYEKIKNKKSESYIEKFNDDSLKVLDANGNILNIYDTKFVLNLQEFIRNYSLDMTFLNSSLENYKRNPDFYSTIFLSAKYMDFAFFTKSNIRPEFVGLASIYLDEAIQLLDVESLENKAVLKQRIDLLKAQEDLLLQHPKKVLRKLHRIKTLEITNVNTGLRSFLYLASYTLLQDEPNGAIWEEQVSSWDKKKLISMINNGLN